MEYDVMKKIVQLTGQLVVNGTHYYCGDGCKPLTYRSGTLTGEMKNKDSWQYIDLEQYLLCHTTSDAYYSEALRSMADLWSSNTEPLEVSSIDGIGINIDFRCKEYGNSPCTLAVVDDYIYSSIEDTTLYPVIVSVVLLARDLGFSVITAEEAEKVIDYVKSCAKATYECRKNQGYFEAFYKESGGYVQINTFGGKTGVLFPDGSIGGELWLHTLTLRDLACRDLEPEEQSNSDNVSLADVLITYYDKIGIEYTKAAVDEVCRVIGLCQEFNSDVLIKQLKELGGFE